MRLPDPPQAGERGAGDPAVVLVVDDDRVTRTVVARSIEEMGGVTVLEAPDGEAAQAVLGERAVDLVVTDLRMPGLDGLALIRWARTHHPETDWIILSGVETFDAAIEAIHVGAFDFLSKPPRMQQLHVSLRNVLEHRRLVRERRRLIAELEEANTSLAAKVRELETASELIRRDLERAEVIQRALLPAEPPRLDGYRVTALYRPGHHVGGDLYHVTRVGPHHLAVCVADATGHGVSSAMLSVLFYRRLVVVERSGVPLPPAQVLERVNQAICEDRVVAGVFLTAAYCLVDLETNEAAIAGAGHPPVLLRSADGGCRRILRTGPVLGLTPTARYGEEHVRLGRGDRLLFFTDGLLQGGDGEGTLGRLEEVLAQPRLAGEALVNDLLNVVTVGRGSAAANGRGPHGNGDRAQPGADPVAAGVGGAAAPATGPSPSGDGGGAGPTGADREPDELDPEDRDDLTVLLLEASPGPSHFENRPGRSPGATLHPGRGGAAPTDPVLWYGETEEHAFLQVRGRGTWQRCDAFHATVRGLLEDGRSVVVDLSECPYVDSTFLGTFHELAAVAENTRGAALQLQGVHPEVRSAFEELGLTTVLATVREPALPLPSSLGPLGAALEGTGSRLRVLRAHEALASLSARNRDKFLAVVETIRSQMGEGGAAGR